MTISDRFVTIKTVKLKQLMHFPAFPTSLRRGVKENWKI